MKHLSRIFVLVLSLSILIFACKDDELLSDQNSKNETTLEEGGREDNTSSDLLSHQVASQAGLESSLLSSYSLLLGKNGFYSGGSNWFWGSVLGGEAHKGSNAGDQSQVNELVIYSGLTTNPSVFEKYSTNYEAIRRANFTLASSQIAQNDTLVSAEVNTRIQAEARFLRGHFYFDIKKNFSNGPYLDENWDGFSPVANDKDLWPFIQADFEFAFQNLPAAQSEVGRANKWAAGAYLGKALLFQGKFAEAKNIFDQVLSEGVTASGVAYALLPSYADAFRVTMDNSSESVFAIQAASGTGDINNANPEFVMNYPHGSASPVGCCGFFQPSFELGNSFRTDATGLPLLDGSYNSTPNELVTDFGLASTQTFTADAGNLDPRIDHSIGRRDIPYLDWGVHPGADWIRDQSYGGPYSPKKFVFYQNSAGVEENDASSWTPGYSTLNYNIIRFSDVLLMAAEAEIELGNLGAALDYINQVRTRAAGSVLLNNGVAAANYVISNYASFANADDARLAVRMERKLELSGEGHRLYDLVRWGIASDALNQYLTYQGTFLNTYGTGTFTAGKNEYLPIPQNSIDDSNGLLVQNPGY